MKLPSIRDVLDIGEAAAENPLPYDTIPPRKYPLFRKTPFPVEEIKWQKPQQNPENKPKNQETRGKRGKANRPAISSNLDEPTPTPAEDPEIPAELPVEEEMEPMEQDNDWRKAVEEALRASEEKN